MAFTLPKLGYDYDALKTHIDKRTMTIHHTKHHQAYINNLNNAIAGTPLEKQKIEEILKNVSKHSMVVRNNGGGHYNHDMFWKIISPNGGGLPKGALAKAIDADLGGYDKFLAEFKNAATTRFGSGWAWLSVDDKGKLFVSSTPNQDNPLMDVAEKRGTPIMGIDVWEHAYYLKYQNKRPDYVNAFFNVIDWSVVARYYTNALKKK
jgi:superoxide dismutase, Fe-Mn family